MIHLWKFRFVWFVKHCFIRYPYSYSMSTYSMVENLQAFIAMCGTWKGPKFKIFQGLRPWTTLQCPPNPPAVFLGHFTALPTALRAVVRDAKHFSGFFINLASCMQTFMLWYYGNRETNFTQCRQILLNVVKNLVTAGQLGLLLIQIFQKYFFC